MLFKSISKLAVLLVICGLILGGCGGGDEHDNNSICSKSYVCDDSTSKTVIHLDRRPDDTCWSSDIQFMDDGRINDFQHKQSMSWFKTANGISVCVETVCMLCNSISNELSPIEQSSLTSSASSGSTGKCKGSSNSCSSQSPGSCSSLRGCYLGYKTKWDGTMEEECKGSANLCSEFSDQDSCQKQTGCSWSNG